MNARAQQPDAAKEGAEAQDVQPALRLLSQASASAPLPLRDEVLTQAQAAAIFGVKADTMHKLRLRGKGPPFVRVNRYRVLYLRRDLLAWFEQRRVVPEFSHSI